MDTYLRSGTTCVGLLLRHAGIDIISVDEPVHIRGHQNKKTNFQQQQGAATFCSCLCRCGRRISQASQGCTKRGLAASIVHRLPGSQGSMERQQSPSASDVFQQRRQ